MKIYLADTTHSIIDSTSEIVKNLIDKNQKCIVFAEDKITPLFLGYEENTSLTKVWQSSKLPLTA